MNSMGGTGTFAWYGDQGGMTEHCSGLYYAVLYLVFGSLGVSIYNTNHICSFLFYYFGLTVQFQHLLDICMVSIEKKIAFLLQFTANTLLKMSH